MAIAKDYSTSAFHVNIGLLEKAGIEVPKEGWTYDDFLAMAQQLTVDKNGNNATSPDFDPANVAVWGASSPWWGGTTAWWRGFQSFLYSWGTKTISDDAKTTKGYLNSEEAVKAWTWWRDLILKHKVAPAVTDLAATNLGNDKLFTQNQLAIASVYWGPWFQDVFNQTPDLKWQAVPLPTGPDGHKAAIMWMGWGINPKSKVAKEACTLLKWLTTEPGQRVFALKALTARQGDRQGTAEDRGSVLERVPGGGALPGHAGRHAVALLHDLRRHPGQRADGQDAVQGRRSARLEGRAGQAGGERRPVPGDVEVIA